MVLHYKLDLSINTVLYSMLGLLGGKLDRGEKMKEIILIEIVLKYA